ncbi:MAG TPA: trypsin-like peptidase domain-containing protein [Candidatus Dormibacteraeota bacterium]
MLAALAIGFVLAGLAVLIPTAVQRLEAARPTPTPVPTPTPTPPPAAVLLPDELDRDLDGVMTIVNDHTFGTAFLIDTQGDFLTAASLVSGSEGLRLVDNTGGMHQVRVIGIDAALGVAQIRAAGDGTPIAFGDPTTLQLGDPVVLLASPKVANLRTSTPAFLTEQSATQLVLRVDDLPGNLGGPVIGPGGKVLGVLTIGGKALPINLCLNDIGQWRGQSGTVKPLAPLPGTLVLRGSDSTSAPTGGPSVQSVSPTRASTAQDTLVTIQGAGFLAGATLRVHFVPLASPAGEFDGLAAAVVNPSTLTVKVAAGRAVQDYVIQLTNGDGAVTSSRTAFTVTP